LFSGYSVENLDELIIILEENKSFEFLKLETQIKNVIIISYVENMSSILEEIFGE
jgi:hypothetical protein